MNQPFIHLESFKMIHYLPSRKRCWQMKNIFVNYVHRHWIGATDWNRLYRNWSPLRRSGFTVIGSHNSRPGFRKGDFILSKESQKEDTHLKTCASCARTFNDVYSIKQLCPRCGPTRWLGQRTVKELTPNFPPTRAWTESEGQSAMRVNPATEIRWTPQKGIIHR